jgi:prepilin signal peptidase PulO-like enzyme (type II secretory pathway)
MIIIAVSLLGLIFGSFVNALVWRLRKQDELAESRHSRPDRESSPRTSRSDTTSDHSGLVSGSKRQKVATELVKLHGFRAKPEMTKEENYSILHGRSMCPHCHHTLAAKDLVPVFSWLFLRGKCRYCKAPISWQYPLVELLTAILFVLSYIFWPYGFDAVGWVQFAAWLVFLVGFVALTVYDIRWQELPDRIVWPLAALAVVETVLLAISKHDWHVALWAALGVAVISGLFWLLFEISNGKWIGFGDVKLGIVLGLLAGTPLAAMMVIFFASVLGTLASIPMIIKTKQKLHLHVPFGPFLIAGLVIVYFFGTTILNWYTGLFL